MSELEQEVSKPKASDLPSPKPGEGRVMYSVLTRPDHATAQIAARIAKLEQQVHNIQTTISPSDSKVVSFCNFRLVLCVLVLI